MIQSSILMPSGSGFRPASAHLSRKKLIILLDFLLISKIQRKSAGSVSFAFIIFLFVYFQEQ